MFTVFNLLMTKGSAVWSVNPQTTLLEALRLLAEKDIGALVVIDQGKLVGIISERDFARMIADSGQCLINMPVESYMTKEVVTVTPDNTVEECMQLMTKGRFRHLPVLKDGQMVGVISIGDVVKEMISNRESMISVLEDYIQGRGYGR